MKNRISVAVLDTGVYRHIDFDNRIIGFYDTVKKRTQPYDDCGHGTHVCGIIAGSGRASNGKFKGIAPMTYIVGVKVLDNKGNGRIADVIDGVKWVLDNKGKYSIKVVNISFGTLNKEMEEDSQELVKYIEKLWDEGIVVVAAAGNNGPGKNSVTVPGTSRKIITVGAFDDAYFNRQNEKRLFYSGRGPTDECIVKPDVVVAGADIIACSNKKNAYSAKSGTSMSTPVVSGAVARVLSYKNMTPKEIKKAIKKCCVKIDIPNNQQGWGMLDIVKFVNGYYVK